MTMKSFALIGAAGYVAPRHMKAISDVGGELKVAFDPKDSVGVLDSHFPDARFFVEFERFDRHIDKLRRSKDKIEYVSICSPNHLHDAHTRFALRSDADVICEKPLVLNPWNLDGLVEVSERTGHRINTILQLRLHPAIRALGDRVAAGHNIHDLDLTYHLARALVSRVMERRRRQSWRHRHEYRNPLFRHADSYLRPGAVEHRASSNVRACGWLSSSSAPASAGFFRSPQRDLPQSVRQGQTTWRSLKLDGEEVGFSDGFTNLHTDSYREILAGRGFGIDQVRPSVEIASAAHRQNRAQSWRTASDAAREQE